MLIMFWFLTLASLYWFYRQIRRIGDAAASQPVIGGADVFVSYSKLDKDLAHDLAIQLRRKGYSVWWDSSLVSGDNFRTTILQELAAAKAVLVIWTKNSANSEWVISEAQRASSQNKLVPLRTSDLDPMDIPPPFDVRHTEILTDFGSILRALERKKVAASLAADNKLDATPKPAAG